MIMDQKSYDVAAVIPAYNEELTIGTVVLKTRKFAETVVVVDDGSKDRTAEVAHLAGAEVVKLDRNHGKAYALKRGLEMVSGNGFSAAVLLDGDGQHNPEEIERLLVPILTEEADLVIGSRFMDGGTNIPRCRKAGQKVLNGFTNIGAKQKISATQSGFRALGRKAMQNLDFHSEGYGVESDMITHFSDSGLRIKEVPVTAEYKVPNGHKANSLSMGMSLMGRIVSTVGYRRPLLMFGIPGAAFTLSGIVLLVANLLQFHVFQTWISQMMVAAFLVLLGAFFAVSGLMLNSLSLMMKKSQKC